MADRAELLERFRRGPEVVAAALTGAAGSEVDYQPAPDEWSVRQIVAHLADSEIVGTTRFRRTIAEDNPAIEWYDEKAWAEKLDYARRKYSASLETFRRIRSENYDLLNGLAEEAWTRPCAHTKFGPMTLYGLLKTYAEHAESHAMQIRRVREAFKAARAGVGA
jgi:hypothetical protein